MIGDRIQNVRKYFGETQQELADSIHMSVFAVRSWERNKSSLTIDSLTAICNHYQVSADYLLGLIDDDPGMAKLQKSKLSPKNRVMLHRFEEFLLYEQKKETKDRR